MAGTELKADQIPLVRLGTVDEVRLYQITESELDTLEQGSLNSTFFNLAIFSITSAISFLIALTTANIESDRIFIVYTVVVLVGFLSGGVLLILCWKLPNKFKQTIKSIRGRISDIPTQESE